MLKTTIILYRGPGILIFEISEMISGCFLRLKKNREIIYELISNEINQLNVLSGEAKLMSEELISAS